MREDTFDPELTLSMTISRTLLSWLTPISDSISLVVALLTAETLSRTGEASIIFDFKLDLWLGLRTFTCDWQKYRVNNRGEKTHEDKMYLRVPRCYNVRCIHQKQRLRLHHYMSSQLNSIPVIKVTFCSSVLEE